MRTLVKLNQYEKQFLKKYKLKAAQVFDATKIFSSKEWKYQIKETDCVVALCATSCTKNIHHRLKLKAGHCAMCNPKNMGFQKTYRSPGDIYVAFSKNLNLTKVGRSKKIGIATRRVSDLNRQGYGETKDWVLKFYAEVSSAFCGVIESEIHNLLGPFKVDNLEYQRGRDIELSREVFNCSPTHATRVAKKVIKQYESL
jgi:hypothetical protein